MATYSSHRLIMVKKWKLTISAKSLEIFEIFLLQKYLLSSPSKEDKAETWHTFIGHCPLQKLCLLFKSDKNSGCYGNL